MGDPLKYYATSTYKSDTYYNNGKIKQEVVRQYHKRGPIIKQIDYNANGDTIKASYRVGGNGTSYIQVTKDYYSNGRCKREVWDGTNCHKPTYEYPAPIVYPDNRKIEYSANGDTLSYQENAGIRDCGGLGRYHTIKKYAGGKGRVEKIGYDGYIDKSVVYESSQTFNGKPVKSIEDLGKGYCKVISLDGKESYYNKDGTCLKKEYVEKQTQGWFMDLVDNVKSWF